DVDELAMLVRFPVGPEDAVWKEESTPARKLTAVVRFTDQNAAIVESNASKGDAATQHSTATENWFPGELLAQSEMSGDGRITGTSYPATEFIQPPFSDGRITRVPGTPFFILELNAR
ncbi:MAG: hypothetical protein ABR535_04330, partial [Pyrinomonadaceae bacterium]